MSNSFRAEYDGQQQQLIDGEYDGQQQQPID